MAIKGPMTSSQWEAVEDYYQKALNNIIIPDDPQPTDIKEVEAKLDALYTEARVDFAICRRMRDSLERKFKAAHKEVFLAVKDGGKTEKEREGLVVQHLRTNPVDGMKIDIYTALDTAEHRFIFMEAVVDILKEKHERCITCSGIMKLEKELMQ